MIRIPDTGNEGSLISGNINIPLNNNGEFNNLTVSGYSTATIILNYVKEDTYLLNDLNKDLGEENSYRYIEIGDDLINVGSMSSWYILSYVEENTSNENKYFYPGTYGHIIPRVYKNIKNKRMVASFSDGNFGMSGGNATLPKIYSGPTRANAFNTGISKQSYTIVKPGHYLLIFLNAHSGTGNEFIETEPYYTPSYDSTNKTERESKRWYYVNASKHTSSAYKYREYLHFDEYDFNKMCGSNIAIGINNKFISLGTDLCDGTYAGDTTYLRNNDYDSTFDSWNKKYIEAKYQRTYLDDKISFCFGRFIKEKNPKPTNDSEISNEQTPGTEILILNGNFSAGDVIDMHMGADYPLFSDTLGLYENANATAHTHNNTSRAMVLVYVGPSTKSSLSLLPVTESSFMEDNIYNYLDNTAYTYDFTAPMDGTYLFLLTGRGNGLNFSPTNVYSKYFCHYETTDGSKVHTNNEGTVNIHDIFPAIQVCATSGWSTGLRFLRFTMLTGQHLGITIPAATTADTTFREIIPTLMHVRKTDGSKYAPFHPF